MAIPRSRLRCPPLLLAALSLAPLAAQSTPREAAPPRDLGERLERCVRERLDPAARVAIVVTLGDQRVLQFVRGRVDPAAAKAEITPQHLFDLGSVAKSVTACAVLRLQELGSLRLDDPLVRHFEGLPDAAAGVTVRHVLGHTAALPKAIGLSAAARDDGALAAREILAARDAATPPGKAFAYSNCGYQLLAALVERVAKQPFERFVQRELFARAKLPTATLVGGSAPNASLRTRRVDGERSLWIEQFPSGFGRKGTTGVLMSLEDVVRWDAALRSGTVLQAESLAEQHREGPGGYGLGWFVSTDEHGLRLAHGGAVEGYRCHVSRWPERGACIAVLGDAALDADGLAAALERELFPGAAGGKARVGAAVPAFPVVDDVMTLAAQREWRWIDAKTDLHAFLPRAEAGAAPPVAAYLYVDRESAKTWLAAMRAAAPQLDRKAPRQHVVRVRGDTLQPPWSLAARLSPFVAEPAAGAATVRIGLRRGQGPAALELEFDVVGLEAFAAALAAVLER